MRHSTRNGCYLGKQRRGKSPFTTRMHTRACAGAHTCTSARTHTHTPADSLVRAWHLRVSQPPNCPFKHTVLFHSGLYYRMPLPQATELSVSQFRSLKVGGQVPEWSVLAEVLFRGSLMVSSRSREGSRLPQNSYKGADPTHGASTFKPNHFPKAITPNAITLGDRVSNANLGETHSVCSTRPP